jgi:hypothetical protein
MPAVVTRGRHRRRSGEGRPERAGEAGNAWWLSAFRVRKRKMDPGLRRDDDGGRMPVFAAMTAVMDSGFRRDDEDDGSCLRRGDDGNGFRLRMPTADG